MIDPSFATDQVNFVFNTADRRSLEIMAVLLSRYLLIHIIGAERKQSLPGNTSYRVG